MNTKTAFAILALVCLFVLVAMSTVPAGGAMEQPLSPTLWPGTPPPPRPPTPTVVTPPPTPVNLRNLFPEPDIWLPIITLDQSPAS